MTTSVRMILVGLVLACLATACTSDGKLQTSEGPSGQPSPTGSQDDHAGILTIKRELPDGPLFIEGSAAYARVTDGSGNVVLEGYFDVPRVPGSSNDFPRKLRGDLQAGDYQLVVYQRPCDAGACSGGDPTDWGKKTRRCDLRLHLAAGEHITAIAVVRSEGCRIAERSLSSSEVPSTNLQTDYAFGPYPGSRGLRQ